MIIFIINLDQISGSFLTEFLEIEVMSQRKLFKSLLLNCHLEKLYQLP